MTQTRRTFLIVALTSAVTACGATRGGGGDTASDPATTIRVENQGFLDRVIYLVQGSQRIRIGQVSGNSTQVLRIPARYVFGPTQMQFIADPVGSNVAPISDTITVSPGDQVTLLIPPS